MKVRNPKSYPTNVNVCLSKGLPHHEVSSHAGLEDSIKGAPGVRTVVEGEHFVYVVQAALVISCAHHQYRHLGVKLRRSVILSTWRIEDIPQLHRHVELLWIAGMGHSGLHVLSLKEVKQI